MRNIIIAGNWKMNKDFADADDFLDNITTWMKEIESDLPGVDVIVCPPYLYLEMATDFSENTELYIGAQNVSQNENGAYTGEISASMLDSVGVEYCIIGHSERRKFYHETDELVNQKIAALFRNKIVPIICIGETEQERTDRKTEEVLQRQLQGSLEGVDYSDDLPFVIAYEPVWAIGTGKTATPEMAQEAHAFIRGRLVERYGEDKAGKIHILYGGSVKPENIEQLLRQEDIDGALIGGASLDLEKFKEMVLTAIKVKDED